MMSPILGDPLPVRRLFERRAAFRHHLAVAVQVGGTIGQVRDLSTRGLYFLTDAPIYVGTLVDLTLTLPSPGPSGPLLCQVTVRILRTESVDGRLGVAAEIEAWLPPHPVSTC